MLSCLNHMLPFHVSVAAKIDSWDQTSSSLLLSSVWSSAAVAHLLQVVTGCAFRDALLHSLVATTSYLSSCYVPMNSFSSDLWCQHDIFAQRTAPPSIVSLSLWTWEMTVWGNPSININVLGSPHSNSRKSPFFWRSVWTSLGLLDHVYMHQVVSIRLLSYTGQPNNVRSVFKFQ